MIVSVIEIILMLSALFVRFKKRKNFYIFTVAVFAILAFFVVPTAGMDLQRHYEMLDSMRSRGFYSTVELYDYVLKDLPIYAWYFYIVSFFNINQLLLSLTYIIVYGTQLGILHMAVKDFSLSYQAEKIGYIFIICTTNAYELTGIRNMTAFSLCVLFLYLELVRKKNRIISWGVYITLCFFHDSVILFVIIRFLVFITNRKRIRWLAIFAVLWPTLINYVMHLLEGYTQSTFLVNVLQKLVLYSSEDANVFTSGFSFELMIWLRLTIVVLVFIAIIFIKRYKRYIKWRQFFLLLVMICIGGMSVKAMVVRFLPLALYMMAPYVGVIYTTEKGHMDVSNAHTILRLLLLGVIVLHFVSLVIFQYPYFEIGLVLPK